MEEFLVKSGGQWVGMVEGGACRIHGWSQEYKNVLKTVSPEVAEVFLLKDTEIADV